MRVSVTILEQLEMERVQHVQEQTYEPVHPSKHSWTTYNDVYLLLSASSFFFSHP